MSKVIEECLAEMGLEQSSSVFVRVDKFGKVCEMHTVPSEPHLALHLKKTGPECPDLAGYFPCAGLSGISQLLHALAGDEQAHELMSNVQAKAGDEMIRQSDGLESLVCTLYLKMVPYDSSDEQSLESAGFPFPKLTDRASHMLGMEPTDAVLLIQVPQSIPSGQGGIISLTVGMELLKPIRFNGHKLYGYFLPLSSDYLLDHPDVLESMIRKVYISSFQ